ncbi:hypothetical protein K3495_g17147, partial [Podosphaera aphanis]
MTQIKRDDGIFGNRLTTGQQTEINLQPKPSIPKSEASEIPHIPAVQTHPLPSQVQQAAIYSPEIQDTEEFYRTYDASRQQHPGLPTSKVQYPKYPRFPQQSINPKIEPDARLHPEFNVNLPHQ